MFARMISNILIIQLLCVLPFGNFVQADMGKTLQKQGKKSLLKPICGEGGGGMAGEIGCKGLDIIASNEGFLEEVVNTVLMLSMTLALVNGDCSKTKAGKKFKPKSYTAGITHWIHKIASLIYIYAEVQNIITLRSLDKKFAKKSDQFEDGQNNKFQAMYSIQTAKKDAADKKLKILKVSTMGLGAAAAIELGMTAVYAGWGMYLKGSEVTECTSSGVNLANCGTPGVTNATETQRYVARGKEIANQCTARFKTINMTGTLVKTAKSTVMKTVVKGITAVVGGAIGKGVAKGLGGKEGAQIAGAATGAVVGAKLADKISEKITESVTKMAMQSETATALNDKSNSEGAEDLNQLKKEPMQCIKGKVKAEMKNAAMSLAQSTTVTSTCGSVVGAAACPAAISISCATKAILDKEGCLCALRNTKSFGSTLEKISSNLKMPKDVAKDEKFLEKLALDIKADKRLTVKGVKKDDDTCGVDYSNWGVRHDLECKAVFDFLNGDEEEKAKDPSIKTKQAFMKGFGKEMNTLASFNMEKMLDIHTGLKTDSPEKWAMLFLNDDTLIEEYRYLNPEQKEKTNKALGFLSEALVHLQNSIISSAHAQEADEFIDTGRETSVLGGLGITAIGMLIFPKFIKKSLHMTTVLQRNPLRRGIFYLATYFMANMSVKSTKKKIKTIDHNIKIIESIMIKDGIPFPNQNEEESAFNTFLEFLIPSAYAARKNMITENLVPLCVEGKKFTTSCTCVSQGTCGNAITNVKLGGALFQNNPLKKTVLAQLSFMQKMETGKVTDANLDQLEQTMQRYAKDLNPVTAANNIDWVLRGSEFPKMNIVQRSKGLVASLQKQGIEEIAKLSGKKIDLTKIDFNSDVTIDSPDLSNDTTKEDKAEPKAKNKLTGIVPTQAKRIKSQKKEENLKDFVLDVGDINQNETHSIFKIINNRYQKVWSDKKIIAD